MSVVNLRVSVRSSHHGHPGNLANTLSEVFSIGTYCTSQVVLCPRCPRTLTPGQPDMRLEKDKILTNLCSVQPGSIALHCTSLHCTAPHCTAMHLNALHSTSLQVHCTSLHRTAPHSTAMHLNALHSTSLQVQCTSLHCTAPHCTALYARWVQN